MVSIADAFYLAKQQYLDVLAAGSLREHTGPASRPRRRVVAAAAAEPDSPTRPAWAVDPRLVCDERREQSTNGVRPLEGQTARLPRRSGHDRAGSLSLAFLDFPVQHLQCVLLTGSEGERPAGRFPAVHRRRGYAEQAGELGDRESALVA